MMGAVDRNDNEFVKRCRALMAERVGRGLAKPIPKEISLREAQNLILRTESWKKVEEEMRTKPKKESIFR
jgi:hypothetical protein